MKALVIDIACLSSLQMFHIFEKAGTGGESVLLDGFKAASILHDIDPVSYGYLAQVLVRGHQAEKHLSPIVPYPILYHHPVTKKLMQVRYNNLDRHRIENITSSKDCQGFYQALRQFDAILNGKDVKNPKTGELVPTPKLKVIAALEPGTAVVVDNLRVMHGRLGYNGSRKLVGAYMTHDDYRGRLASLFKRLNAAKRVQHLSDADDSPQNKE